MERKDERLERWLDMATRKIGYRPDRSAVRRELAEHLEDKISDLEGRWPDMAWEEARDRALDQMGDPAEIGRNMSKIHNPWWGWALDICHVVLTIMVVLICMKALGGYTNKPWRRAYNIEAINHQRRAVFPSSMAQAGLPAISQSGLEGWDHLALGGGVQGVTVDVYDITIPKAAVVQDRESGRVALKCVMLLEYDKPWDYPENRLSGTLTARDGDGTVYARGTVDQSDDLGTLFWQESVWTLALPPEEREEFLDRGLDGLWLDFDNGLTQFSIPIQWEEVAAS